MDRSLDYPEWIDRIDIAYRRIQQLLAEKNLILYVKVIEYCHEGIIVELESNLELIPTLYLKNNLDLLSLVGETIPVKLINAGLVTVYENTCIKLVNAWVLSYGIESLEYDRIGDRVTGTVASIEELGAWVDIGIYSPEEGLRQRHVYIPNEKISRSLKSIAEYLPIGTTREFLISYYYIRHSDSLPEHLHQRESLSNISLSIIDLEESIAQQRLAQMQAENVTIQAKVIGYESRRNRVSVEIDNSIVHIDSISLGKIYLDLESIAPIIPLKVIDVERKILIHPDVMDRVKAGTLFPGTIERVYPIAYMVNIGIGRAILRQAQILKQSDKSDAHSEMLLQSARFKIGDRVMVKMIFYQKPSRGIEFSTEDLPTDE